LNVIVEDDPEPLEIDVTVAHPARMYDYYLGGNTHFAAPVSPGASTSA
jgi:hypothetical protein